MAVKRKRLQGVINILRFNWSFYLLAAMCILTAIIVQPHVPLIWNQILFWFAAITTFAIIISIAVSMFVYDFSDLYDLPWINDLNHKKVLNINAGFDETSELILDKYPSCRLTICDFYDPKKHTEISIERARKVYPAKLETIQVSTYQLPFPNQHFDTSLAIFSAHEIRDQSERIAFFKELRRVTKLDGEVMVTEHLRDLNNFLAYTFGFFHFHSKPNWLQTFQKAGLNVTKEIKTTPFITTFVLKKHGNSL